MLLRDLFLPTGSAVARLQFSHFLYFMMFQVGVVAIYFLALRWVSRAAAFGTARVFCTQPVIYGHASMNPKDVVFMSLMIASAVLGFWMLDRGGKASSTGMRSFFQPFLQGDVWLAGILLGFTSAIRIAAPLVGIIHLAYIVLTRKWNLLPRLLAYGLIALFSMILFWPYLAKLTALLESGASKITTASYLPKRNINIVDRDSTRSLEPFQVSDSLFTFSFR